MADREDLPLQSVADWLTPTKPFQFENSFSSNDFQMYSHFFLVPEGEASVDAPMNSREYTYPQSPLNILDNLFSDNTSWSSDTSFTSPLVMNPTWGPCNYAEATEEDPQMPSCDARQPLYHTSTERFDSDIADSGSSSSHAEQSPGRRCGLRDDSFCERSNRRVSHNEVEKRYRQNLDRGFRHLKDILTHHAEDKTNRMTRTEILGEAYTCIAELRGKVGTLQVELKDLREALFPDTCKYTLADGEPPQCGPG